MSRPVLLVLQFVAGGCGITGVAETGLGLPSENGGDLCFLSWHPQGLPEASRSFQQSPDM